MKNKLPLLIRYLKLFSLPVVTLVIVVLLSTIFLIPKITETQTIIEENEKDKKTLLILEKKAKKLDELDKSPLLTDYEKVASALPSEKNIPYIFAAIDEMTRENNIHIEGLSVSDEKLVDDTLKTITPGIPNGTGEILFNLNVIGAEEAILIFIDRLQQSSPFIKISTIGLNVTNGIMSSSLLLSSYYQPLPSSLGKFEASLPELSSQLTQTAETVKNFTTMDGLPLITQSQVATPSAGTRTPVNLFDL